MTNQEKIYGIIYKVTFPSGKVYIGQTRKTLETRKSRHLLDLKKDKCTFHRAIHKYGIENTEWEKIDTAASTEELNKKEIYWIKFYNSYVHSKNSNGYNLTTGGGGTSGYIHTEESRQKMSKAWKRETHLHAGWRHTSETKEKMRQNHSNFFGKNNPAYGKRGELNSSSKLNWNKVKDIRSRYVPNKVTLQQLANEYSVSLITVWNIVNDKSWRAL